MPPVPVLFRFFAVAAIAGSTAFADTIHLTTGEKIDGKVIKETATEYTVEVRVSASIKDEQVIPKANVAKIETEQPDEVAWRPLKNIRLGQNSLQPAQYDPLLAPLQAFANDYPLSSHTADAKKAIEAITAEKQRVEAGEIRLGEKWLSKEEADRERYQIQARIAVQYLRSQRAANDFIGALNSFDLIEKNFSGAQTFPEALDLARETLTTLKTVIDAAQRRFQAAKAEFDAGVAKSAPQQRAELLAARQRELAVGEAALAAADRAKVKWPALVQNSDKNLEAIAKKIPSELQRLQNSEFAKLREAVQLAEQGRQQIEEKKPEAVETLAKAISISPKNELAKRLQPEAAALKAAALATAQAEARAAEAEAKATPTPKPAAARSVTQDAAQVEKEKSFFLTPGGIITVLVLLAVAFAGWSVYNKIRHRANDVLE